MSIKSLIYRSFAEPKLSQLEYAEECLEGQHSKIEEYLAAVNTGFYPIGSKGKILQKVQEDKKDLQESISVSA